MQWIEVSVPTRSDEIDDVCAQLAELGAGGMVVEDEKDFQQFLEQNHQYWDYVDDALEAQFRGVSRIKFYLADDDGGRAQLEAIRAQIAREKQIAQTEIANEREAAIREMRNEVVTLSMAVAEKLLQKNMDPDMNAKLVADCIDQLQTHRVKGN